MTGSWWCDDYTLHSTSITFFGIGHARLGNAVDVHTGFLGIGSAYPFLSETAQGAHFITTAFA